MSGTQSRFRIRCPCHHYIAFFRQSSICSQIISRIFADTSPTYTPDVPPTTRWLICLVSAEVHFQDHDQHTHLSYSDVRHLPEKRKRNGNRLCIFRWGRRLYFSTASTSSISGINLANVLLLRKYPCTPNGLPGPAHQGYDALSKSFRYNSVKFNDVCNIVNKERGFPVCTNPIAGA